MGIGMVLIVHGNEVLEIIKELKLMDCDSYIIGKVIKGKKQVII
jgi:phosphoribosylaminoimidazole (AIR) synthetase